MPNPTPTATPALDNAASDPSVGGQGNVGDPVMSCSAPTPTQAPEGTPPPVCTPAPTQAPEGTPPPVCTPAPTQAPEGTPPPVCTPAPTQAPEGTPPPVCTPAPTQPPPCCCCVTSATIENVTEYLNSDGFGHSFDFVIQMDFSGGSASTSDCTLQWWERMDLPNWTGAPANTWVDQFASYPSSPTFDPWNNRTAPCPGGGALTITLNDPPGLTIRPGRTAQRHLDFRLVVNSGSGAGCSCDNGSTTATASQNLQIINGVPQLPSVFTTP